MNEIAYARALRTASVMENIRMRQSMTDFGGTGRGGNPLRIPEKLMDAARQLQRKGSLTATDLGHILSISQPNAIALLFRLERIGLAISELHHDARIRIFSFNKQGLEPRGVSCADGSTGQHHAAGDERCAAGHAVCHHLE